jgi:hypothetical protein
MAVLKVSNSTAFIDGIIPADGKLLLLGAGLKEEGQPQPRGAGNE